MKILAIVLFYLLYWGICYLGTGTDKKNMASFRAYSDAVQKAVKNRPELTPMIPKESAAWKVWTGNLMLFTAVFSVAGLLSRNAFALTSYAAAFGYLLALGEGLGLFDLVVVDLLWWRHTERTRFSFLKEEAPYQDPKKHVQAFLRGIPMFAAAAAAAAGIVALTL